MAWVKIDDAFYDNAKFAELSNGAVGAWAKLLAFSNRNLTDGAITKVFALRFGSRKELGELVAVGLLDETETGWQLHDFLDFQPSADSVREKRAALSAERSAAGKRGGIAKAKRQQTSSNLPDDDLANAKQTSSPDPDPVPVPKKEGTDLVGSADAEPDKRRRRAQLPKDFELTVVRVAAATARGLPNSAVETEFEKFRDFHQAKGSTMLDWDAAWRTWIGNYRGPKAVKPPDGEIERALAKVYGGEP